MHRLALLLLLLPGTLAAGNLRGDPPRSPSESRASFKVLGDFTMELLAAEPLVASPVAIAYDENGRAYVCEMRDYPYTDKAKHRPNQENPSDAPIGRVRLLEDRDSDGVFDHASVFAEDLSWPTGVACWKGGVFVAATPDLWYLKDLDGDGRADERRKIFSGFRKLNVQAVMNNLVWGLDNRIHGAGGSNGGKIEPAGVAMSRQDFAFDPETGSFELLSGGARFGGSFDDWGHRFLCNIRNPAQHVVLPARYLIRNPFLGPASPLADMAESGDQLPVHRISAPESWRVVRAQRWAGERDTIMPRSELVGAGVVTSASGVTAYRGSAYPGAYRENVFVCESSANLFYRLVLSPHGATFKAVRVDGDREMVASSDNWFRPVNFINAPDGTLHVLDMYRENIEHPWSIPDDIHAAVDLEAGRDMGRIWRLTPPGFVIPEPPRLETSTTSDLVPRLDHPNSWWRETVQRLLVERQDPASIPSLRTLAREGRTPQGRLHALWTLHGLKALSSGDVLAGLQDSSPGVRENACRLAEAHAGDAGVINRLIACANDPSPQVRLQIAFTLGAISDPRVLEALSTVARRDPDDPWIRTAVLSSVPDRGDALLFRLLADGVAPALVSELARIVGVRGKADEIQRVLAGVGFGSPVIAALGQGLKQSGRSLRGLDPTTDAVLEQAARSAASGDVPSIQLLAFEEFARAQAPLAALLEPGHSPEVHIAAVRAIGSFPQPETATLLLKEWDRFTPPVRTEVISAMLGAKSRILPLLAAIDQGTIPANQVPFARRAILLKSPDPLVKELANKFFSQATGSRAELIERYRAAFTTPGDPARGAEIFAAVCASCHRAGDTGIEVGPNLATIRSWSPEQVLVNILDPSREVAPNALAYQIETRDGRTIAGLIAEESESSVTIRAANGIQETILRSEIAELSGSGLSLMPEGLEAVLSVTQMADLIAFLLKPIP